MRWIVFLLALQVKLYSGYTVCEQTFDSPMEPWAYSSDTIYFDNGNAGFYGVTNNFEDIDNPAISGNYLGWNDLNDTESGNGTSGFATITFEEVDITGCTGVQVYFDYQAFEFDAGDDIKYEVIVDDVSLGEVVLVDGSSNFSVAGTEVISVNDGSSSVELLLKIKQNGATDFGAIDNVGIYAVTVPNPGILEFPSSLFSIGRFWDAVIDEENWVQSDPLFVIGNGGDEQNKFNALTVLKNGQVGIGLWGDELTESSASLVVAGDIEVLDGGKISFSDGSIQTSAFIPNSSSSLSSPDGTLSDVLLVTNDGDVGIGVSEPAARLEVDGEVKVVSMSFGDIGLSIDANGNLVMSQAMGDIPMAQ
tara:strand:- start:581 stop:1669 length:1089 start_codon:yes stop_codon:yes gene_type:complete